MSASGFPAHIVVAVSEEAEPEPTAGQPTVERPVAEQPPAGTRMKSAARIAVFDVVGPLIAYALLRHAGLSAVTALILSGVLPAIGVITNAVQRRRLDIIGAVVLAGIVVGAVLGLVSHNARLVLLEGSVPTAVFGLACLSSLNAPKPLLFGFAHEFVGPDSVRGREMTRLWQFAGYQRAYRVVTAVWGVGYVVKGRRARGHRGEHLDGYSSGRLQDPPVCRRRHLGRMDGRIRALSVAQGVSA